MTPQQKLILAGSMFIIAMLACQSSLSPIPGQSAAPAVSSSTATLSPFFWTPTASPTNELALPSDFLKDPNTICVIRLFDGLSCLDQTGWHAYGSDSFTDPVRNPWAMAECPDKSIYLYDGLGLYMFKDRKLDAIDITGLSGADFLACGLANDLWVGYMDGVSHWASSTWTNYPVTQYLGSSGMSDLVNSLVIAPDGKVWVTTYNDIAAFDGNTWHVVKSGGNYASLVIDKNGKIWVVDSSETKHILAYDGQQWSTFSSLQDDIRFLAVDRENRVWAATSHDEFFILNPQTNQWTQQTSPQHLGSGNSYTLRGMQFDRQGRLWASSNYGLGVYDGSNWTIYRMDNADLFANDNDRIDILGDAPPLPAPITKASGSVSGKTNNVTASNLRAELCLFIPQYGYPGATPCADQAYHALTTLDANGNFLFKDVPPGKYRLVEETSTGVWDELVNTTSQPFVPNTGKEFEVKPGVETNLGEITPLSTP